MPPSRPLAQEQSTGSQLVRGSLFPLLAGSWVLSSPWCVSRPRSTELGGVKSVKSSVVLLNEW